MLRIGQRAERAGFRSIHKASVVSTMDEAGAAARAGDADRVWFTSDEQTGGRGRHGRSWASPKGNLYSTLFLSDPCRPHFAPQLGFVAGLALRDSLRRLTGDDRFRLKWPNDVLVDGAKLAGILLEGVTLLTRSHRASPAVLIGVGVNVKHHPANLPYAATDLAELGWECDANDVFAALTDAFASRLEQWDCARDFASIRADWIDAAAGVGGPVSVSLPDRTVTGTYTGIDEDGRLLVVTDAGEQIIDAGEVMLRGKAA